jgi:hypothetical protein
VQNQTLFANFSYKQSKKINTDGTGTALITETDANINTACRQDINSREMQEKFKFKKIK